MHDCRTNKIQYDGESVKFFLPDGFYLIHDAKKENGISFNAEMTCRLAGPYQDRFRVTVYRKNLFGQTVRKDWTDDRFVSEINSGKAEFEFVYTYRSYHGILFKGYIWRHKKPWWRECEIELMTDEITYAWEEKDAEAIVIAEK